MVYNGELRHGIERGLSATGADDDPTDQIMHLLAPLLDSGLSQSENMAVYQREILFGDPIGVFRAEALDLIDRLEVSIAEVLRRLGNPSTEPNLRPGVDVTLAARSLVSVLHMEIIRTGLGRETPAGLPSTLRAEIDLLMRGMTAPTIAP